MVYHILSNLPNSLQNYDKVKDVLNMTNNVSIVVIVSYLVSIDHWFLIEHCCIEAELAPLY